MEKYRDKNLEAQQFKTTLISYGNFEFLVHLRRAGPLQI